MSRISLSLSLFALLFLTSTAPAQGLYWESTSTGGAQGDRVVPSKSAFMPKKLRHENPDMVVIIRLDKELMYLMKPKEKTYSEVSFALLEEKMKAVSGISDTQRAEIEKRLKDLPPAQRKIAEDAIAKGPLGKKKDSKIEVLSTSEKKTVAGKSCTKAVATEDGKEILTAWATKDLKNFDALQKDWKDVSKRLFSSNPVFGSGVGEAMQKIDGFPLESELKGVKMVVTKLEEKGIPDAEFEVPAEYKKGKSPFEDLPAPGAKKKSP